MKRSYKQYHRNKLMREYYEQPYTNKLDKIQKFLEILNPPRLNQEEMKNQNR